MFTWDVVSELLITFRISGLETIVLRFEIMERFNFDVDRPVFLEEANDDPLIANNKIVTNTFKFFIFFGFRLYLELTTSILSLAIYSIE